MSNGVSIQFSRHSGIWSWLHSAIYQEDRGDSKAPVFNFYLEGARDSLVSLESWIKARECLAISLKFL
jgi:hypothetical protein